MKNRNRPTIISRQEAIILLDKAVLRGQFFRATFVMQPIMKWSKKLLCKGLAKSFGYARTFKSARFEVKAYLKDSENPQTATTAHIPKYRVVYVMDEDTKNYRNINYETVRVFKTEGIWYWVANCDIPNQIM